MNLDSPLLPPTLASDPAATATLTLEPAARVVVATDTDAIDAPPPSLLDRLAAQHGRRRRLREMERRAGFLADALEEAAGNLRRCFPVHPRVEHLTPPGGIVKFAARLRDLFVEVGREDDALSAELDQLHRPARSAT